MSFAKLAHITAWLFVLANAFAATTLFYLFLSFAFGVGVDESQAMLWIEKALAVLFLVGALFFLRRTWQKFKLARNYTNSNEYKSLVRSSQRSRQPDAAKTNVTTTTTDRYVRDKMRTLIKHNVISQSELDQSDFENTLHADEWDADFYGVSSILMALYNDDPDLFSNLYCRVEQVEVSQQDYAHLIQKLASMLQLKDLPANVRLEHGRKNSTLSFDWAGKPHEFRGNFTAKYLAWDIVPDIARLLETKANGRRICCSATDMQFILTGLTDDELDALSAELNDPAMRDFECFSYLT